MSYQPTLGLSPQEVQRMMDGMLSGIGAVSEAGEHYATGVEETARRLACELAASLIMANNRRLTEQLGQLGLAGSAVEGASRVAGDRAAGRPPAVPGSPDDGAVMPH
jgi:hypothetical protein